MSVNAFVSIDILTIHCRRQSCASSDIPEETWEEVKKICGNVPSFIVLFYQCYRHEHSLTDALKILRQNIARYYVQRVSRLVARNVRTESEMLEDSVLVHNLVNQKAILSVSWTGKTKNPQAHGPASLLLFVHMFSCSCPLHGSKVACL